jgi:hypothetical protein
MDIRQSLNPTCTDRFEAESRQDVVAGLVDASDVRACDVQALPLVDCQSLVAVEKPGHVL